jgi:hypothetical protein
MNIAFVVAFAMASIILSAVSGYASLPISDRASGPTQNLTSIAAAPGGFWVQLYKTNRSFGETLAKDSAPVFGNVADVGSIAAIPWQNGYWVVSDRGDIYARGDALVCCPLKT